jgi:hypothetical protein
MRLKLRLADGPLAVATRGPRREHHHRNRAHKPGELIRDDNAQTIAQPPQFRQRTDNLPLLAPGGPGRRHDPRECQRRRAAPSLPLTVDCGTDGGETTTERVPVDA